MRWEKDGLAVEVLFSRAGLATQILVRIDDLNLLFDAGDGALRDLLRKGLPPQRLHGVFFTHGHADHIAGLYGLLGYLRAEDHRGLLKVWYPEGSKEIETILETFRRCYRGTIPFQVIAHPLKDGETIFLGKASVLARSVKHWNSIKGRPLTPAPAMGYRVEFRGFKVAISGDTAFCPSLIELVRGTDLALIEATLNEEATNDQKTFLHLTQIKARELGQLAKQFWLIHVSM